MDLPYLETLQTMFVVNDWKNSKRNNKRMPVRPLFLGLPHMLTVISEGLR